MRHTLPIPSQQVPLLALTLWPSLLRWWGAWSLGTYGNEQEDTSEHLLNSYGVPDLYSMF